MVVGRAVRAAKAEPTLLLMRQVYPLPRRRGLGRANRRVSISAYDRGLRIGELIRAGRWSRPLFTKLTGCAGYRRHGSASKSISRDAPSACFMHVGAYAIVRRFDAIRRRGSVLWWPHSKEGRTGMSALVGRG